MQQPAQTSTTRRPAAQPRPHRMWTRPTPAFPSAPTRPTRTGPGSILDHRSSILTAIGSRLVQDGVGRKRHNIIPGNGFIQQPATTLACIPAFLTSRNRESINEPGANPSPAGEAPPQPWTHTWRRRLQVRVYRGREIYKINQQAHLRQSTS